MKTNVYIYFNFYDIFSFNFYDIFSGFSLPSDLEIIDSEKLAYNMQNLEVENAMLKNELNVMNREISELLDRLRITEDGMDSIVFICNI